MGQVSWVGRYEHGLELRVYLLSSETRSSNAKFCLVILTLRASLQIYILTVLCTRGSQSVCYLSCIFNLTLRYCINSRTDFGRKRPKYVATPK